MESRRSLEGSAFDEDAFVEFALVEVSRATHLERGRKLHHGSYRCPELPHEASLCDECAEVVHDVVMLLLPKAAALLAREPSAKLGPWIKKSASDQLSEVLRQRRSARGALVRVEQAVQERVWITSLFDDPTDLDLLKLMLFRAGSEEAQRSSRRYPTATWALDLQLDEDGVAARLSRIEAVLREHEPARYENYLETPFRTTLLGSNPELASENDPGACLLDLVVGEGPTPGDDDQIDVLLVDQVLSGVRSELGRGGSIQEAVVQALDALDLHPQESEATVKLVAELLELSHGPGPPDPGGRSSPAAGRHHPRCSRNRLPVAPTLRPRAPTPNTIADRRHRRRSPEATVVRQHHPEPEEGRPSMGTGT